MAIAVRESKLLETSFGKAAQATADILSDIMRVHSTAFARLKQNIANRKMFILFVKTSYSLPNSQLTDTLRILAISLNS